MVVDEVEVEAVVGEASLLEVVAGVLPGVGVVGAHPEAGVVEVEEGEDVGAWVEERRSLWSHTGSETINMYTTGLDSFFPRHAGVFIARGKEDALVTKNMVMGESVYGEKRIAVEDEAGKIEYRVWNPFRSKLAAAILGGVDAIHMPPGSKVLYLGAASGTTVSHVSDVVGPEGMVYAVEFSHR